MTGPTTAIQVTEELNRVDVDDPLPSYKRPLPLKTQLLRFIPVLLSTVLVLGMAIVITNARMPDPAVVRPLPDLLIEWIPTIRVLESFTDVVILLLNITGGFIGVKLYVLERHIRGIPEPQLLMKIPLIGKYIHKFLFFIIDSGARPYPLRGASKIICIRFLVSYAIVMLFRSLVIVMTSYPATDNHCQHPQTIEHPALNVILTLVTLGSGAIHCGDLMFSGHTMILCVMYMVAWEYGPFLHRWAFRVWASLLLPFSYFCIIASRSHYTDDILVAMYCMVATFKLIPHRSSGAPWQLQLLIRWWPCMGANVEEEQDDGAYIGGGDATEVVIETSYVSARQPRQNEGEDNSN